MSINVRKKSNEPLQRETVARAALQLVDEVGLDGLTMRRLATQLDIQNPSLYWHFTNKQELLNCMADLMIADSFATLRGVAPGQDWADWLADYARLVRNMMLGHRDGARILAEADISLSNFIDGLELALGVLQEAGFDAGEAMAGVVSAIHFALGNAFQAQSDPLFVQQTKDASTSQALELSFNSERFPRIAAFLHTIDMLSPATVDAQFEQGLSLLLDGMRANLARHAQSSARKDHA
jgi:TetR/AcrR family tetracycline transcriptional repressor